MKRKISVRLISSRKQARALGATLGLHASKRSHKDGLAKAEAWKNALSKNAVPARWHEVISKAAARVCRKETDLLSTSIETILNNLSTAIKRMGILP